MKYQTKRRDSLNGITKKWRMWIFIYIVTFAMTLFATSEAEETFLIVTIWEYQIITNLQWSINVDITYSLAVVFVTILLFSLTKYLIHRSWSVDAKRLRESFLLKEKHLKALFGTSNADEIRLLEKTHGMRFWELIFIRNYLRYIETTIRQEIRAREKLPERLLIRAVTDILTPLEFHPPLEDYEMEIFLHEMKKCLKVPIQYRIRYRFSPTGIKTTHLLVKGFSETDYKNGVVEKFEQTLEDLSDSSSGGPVLFNEDSIKNVVRLTNKQYDMKIVASNELSVDGYKTQYEIRWIDGIPVLLTGNKLNDSTDSSEEIGFRACILQEQPGNTLNFDDDTFIPNRILLLSGYKMKYLDGTIAKAGRWHLRFNECSKEFEDLERKHRIIIEDLFPQELNGRILFLQDADNVFMSFDALARQLHTINVIVETLKLENSLGFSDETTMSALLRTNLLPTVSSNLEMDRINQGRTITKLGLLNHFLVDTDIHKKLNDIIEEISGLKYSAEPSDKLLSRKVSSLLDIPQLTSGKKLRQIMPAETFAQEGILGWIATGGGAWITEDLRQELADGISENSRSNIPIFFNHPLKEKVFLETLTHQNYHYVWEILSNRIKFMKAQMREDLHLDILWAREAFQPSSNLLIPDDRTEDFLSQLSPIFKDAPEDNCAILTVRNNQLIRSPVNASSLVFSENPHALSPISEEVYNYMIRQKKHSEIALAFSKQDGLLNEDGRPTHLCLSVNWIRPLKIGESFETKPRFDSHEFSNPSTWNNLGFLDLLVKEIKSAYAILKILSTYERDLKRKESLPFRLIQNLPTTRIEDDMRHLTSSFDILCDFMGGKGDFAKEGITAVADQSSYLDWLQITLSQLDTIGAALGAPVVFRNCKQSCIIWLEKMRALFEKLGDPLERKVKTVIEEVEDKS